MDPELTPEELATIPHPVAWGSRHNIVLECLAHTKYISRNFQVDFVKANHSGNNVVCVAGTGSGKSLVFVIINFFHYGCYDMNRITCKCHREPNDCQLLQVWAQGRGREFVDNNRWATQGEYQVVISSPEVYKDANKLRGMLLSEIPANIRHVTVVDEAHTIRTWGDSGFRKDFERTRLFVSSMEGVDLPEPPTVSRSI
ncbi:hypothetical protein FRC09_010803 [Ceratobasidium sp. 395]|nr:hypothetical protein FRC09_010803 [Ceratobasidium sp. 395]